MIPAEKLNLVKEILENDALPPSSLKNKDSRQSEEDTLANDPWKDILEGDE